MKVKAINITGARNITLGKTYDVLEERETAYLIKNDVDRDGAFKKNRFEVVPEVIKMGDVYSYEENHYIIAGFHILDTSFVSLVNVNTGNTFAGLVHTHDKDNISAEEFAKMTDGATFTKVVA